MLKLKLKKIFLSSACIAAFEQASAAPIPAAINPFNLNSNGGTTKTFAGSSIDNLWKAVPLLYSHSFADNLSTANDPGGSSVLCFQAQYNMHDISAHFENTYVNTGAYFTLPPNPVSFAAQLMYPLTQNNTLTFPGLTTTTLPNGLTYYTLPPNTRIDSAKLSLSVPAGGIPCVLTDVRISLPPTISVSYSATGGTIGTGQRCYVATTLAGPQGQSGKSAEQCVSPASGSTNSVNVSFTPNPYSMPATNYALMEGATGAETYLLLCGATGICTDSGSTTAATAWVASTAYTVGQMVTSGGNTYICTTAGTGSTTTPSGYSFIDGTVVWYEIAAAPPTIGQQYPIAGVEDSGGTQGHPYASFNGNVLKEATNYVQDNGTAFNAFGNGTSPSNWGHGGIGYYSVFNAQFLLGVPDAGLDVPFATIFGASQDCGYSTAVAAVVSDLGFWATSFIANNIGYVETCIVGEGANSFNQNPNNRKLFAGKSPYNVIAYNGYNDMYFGTSFGVAQALAIQAWEDIYKRTCPGGSIICSKSYTETLNPYTTSTDSWATTTNQHTNSTFEPNRLSMNAWLRGGAPIYTFSASSASIYGTTLTINTGATCTGTFGPNTVLQGVQINLGTVYITANGTGTGCVGTYTLNYNTTQITNQQLNAVAAATVGATGSIVAGQSGHPISAVVDTDKCIEVNSSNVLTLNGGYWIVNGTANWPVLYAGHPSNNGVTVIDSCLATSALIASEPVTTFAALFPAP